MTANLVDKGATSLTLVLETDEHVKFHGLIFQ